jgi:hypothetical protein
MNTISIVEVQNSDYPLTPPLLVVPVPGSERVQVRKLVPVHDVSCTPLLVMQLAVATTNKSASQVMLVQPILLQETGTPPELH